MKKFICLLLVFAVFLSAFQLTSEASSDSDGVIKILVKVHTDMGFEEEDFSFEYSYTKDKKETELLEELTSTVKSKLSPKKDRHFYSMEMINYVKDSSVTFLPYSVKSNIVDRDRNILGSVKLVTTTDELYTPMMEDIMNSLRTSIFSLNSSPKSIIFNNVIDGSLTRISLIGDTGSIIREEFTPSTKTTQIPLPSENFSKMKLKITHYKDGRYLEYNTNVEDIKKLTTSEIINQDSGLKYAYVLDKILTFNYIPETSFRDRGGFFWRYKGGRFTEEYNNGYPRYRRERDYRRDGRFEDLFDSKNNLEYDPDRQYNKNDFMIHLDKIPTDIQVVLVEENGKEIPLEFRIKKDNYLLTDSAPSYWNKLKMSAFEMIAERDTERVIELSEKDKVNLVDIFEPQMVYEFESNFNSKNLEITVNDEEVKSFRSYRFETGNNTVTIYNKKIDKEFKYFVIVDNSPRKTNFEVKKNLQFSDNLNFREAIKLSDSDFKMDSKYDGFLVVYKNQAYSLEDSVKIDKTISKAKFDIYYKGKKYTINASRIIRNNIVIPKYNNEFIFPILGERKK